MISLARIRELEPKLQNTSDAEVAVVREKIYQMANLAMDSYEEQKDSNFSVGLGDVDEKK
jgi:hypothetical protein